MAVSMTQNPGDYNVAYGPNVVTLDGLGSATKYVLQVQTQTGTVLADIRQSANSNGVAQFDIQNILQTYVSPPDKETPAAGVGNNYVLALSPNEVFKYILRIGSETSGTVTLEPQSYGPYQVWDGVKEYYEENYQTLGGVWPLRASTNGDDASPACTEVTSEARPLTSWRYSRTGSQLAGTPSGLGANETYYVFDVLSGEQMTMSYFNDVQRGTPSPAAQANHIEGFRIVTFSGSTQTQDVVIPNITPNGGGPNASYGGTQAGNDASLIVNVGVGPLNLANVPYTDSSGNAQTFQLGNPTHYYIIPLAYNPGTCLATHTGYSDEPLMSPIRLNVKAADCLDYDPIRFAWLNPYGVMDYFTFKKKNVKSVNTKRNAFLKDANDYDGTTFDIDPASRGYQVYSQTIKENWTATTGYLTDQEAEYLQYLFRSADVRVVLGQNARPGYEAQWFPVVIESTKWTEKTYQKDKLFQYEISFRLANNIKSQRG